MQEIIVRQPDSWDGREIELISTKRLNIIPLKPAKKGIRYHIKKFLIKIIRAL